jgi:hypothetical protein
MFVCSFTAVVVEVEAVLRRRERSARRRADVAVVVCVVVAATKSDDEGDEASVCKKTRATSVAHSRNRLFIARLLWLL